MSENNFTKFVPGFDFLQGLAKGAASNIPQMPNPANWIAPTLSVEELDKRITELKAVQFWLDQNAKALAATVTALEVQKMTLATLKGMNFNMGDVANAFKLKASETVANTVMGVKDTVTEVATGKKPVRKKAAGKTAAKPGASGLGGMIDPMQLWGSLTQQFGQIASSAMKDAAKQTAIDTTKNMAKAMTKTAVNTAMNTANQTMQRMTAAGKSLAPKKVAARAVSTRATGKSKGKKT